MFNMFKNHPLKNPNVKKAVKDICIHFAAGFTAGYTGHIIGEKSAQTLHDYKTDDHKKESENKLK